METQCGRKPHNVFLFIKEYIHWKHQLPISLATTGRRLQPPIYRLQPEGSSNSLIYRLQPEGGYNPLSLPHPTTLKYKCRPICHYHCHVTDNLLLLLFLIFLLLLLISISHQDCNHTYLIPRSTRGFSKSNAYESLRHICT
jgi:hypothetical protein